jgi:Fe-S-cluster-containing hydrogenase component 2
VPEAKKGRLVILPNKCTGCGTCELACSFVHATAERLGRTRIRITDVGPERHVQLTCLQCVDAACTQVCPTEALVRSQETGAVEVNERRCIGCRSCEAACPFGHIHFDQVSSVPVKCDLCQGAPACAAFCPYDALEIR